MSLLYKLIKRIEGYGDSIIAYSGGVDSSLLVLLSHYAGIRFLPVTISSEVTTDEEIQDAKTLTKTIGVKHHIEDIKMLSFDNFRKNSKMRCFYCKEIIMQRLKSIAQVHGYRYIIEGGNLDDLNDWRPGMMAIKQFDEVRSPYIELSISKSNIRDILKQIGANIWNKPSSPCLATRVYYNIELTEPILEMVKKGEDIIRKKGFIDVRVRTNGENALVEVNKEQVSHLLDNILGKEIKQELLSLGFKTVQIAQEGYISGRLNTI